MSIDEQAPRRGSAKALLDILDSEDFATAQPCDPERMEREIVANRDAWDIERIEPCPRDVR